MVINYALTNNGKDTLALLKFSKTYPFLNDIRYFRTILVFSIIFVLLSLIASLILSNRWLAKPLIALSQSISNDTTKPIEYLLKEKGNFAEIARLLRIYFEQRKKLSEEIAERKLIEGQILEEKVKFEQLFENAPIGMIMLNKDENVVQLNKTFTDIFQYTNEDIIGKNLNDFLIPNELIEEAHELSDKTFNEEVAKIETFRKRKDNTLVAVSLFGVPIIYKENKIGIYGMYIDITERKNAEASIIKYNKELKELNQTKDKFFSIIAHDLKSPFSNITGFSEYIEMNLSDIDKEELSSSIKNIKDSAYQAFRLLENLLLWACSQTKSIEFNPDEFDIKYGLQDTYQLAQQIAKSKNIEIEINIEENKIIYADFNMLNTIIRNLLTNAIKFTPKSGKIKLLVEENDKCWYFKVIDSGVGMPKEIIEKLFHIEHKFSTFGTENEAGTGLGLILCKEFVDKHNGIIEVVSEQNKGSEFIFTIPK